MRASFRQSWQLRGIERALRKSDPHMAAMLAIFARLSAGEAILSREQSRRPGNGAWLLLVVVVAGGISRLAAIACRMPGRAVARVAELCAAAGRRLGRNALITP